MRTLVDFKVLKDSRILQAVKKLPRNNTMINIIIRKFFNVAVITIAISQTTLSCVEPRRFVENIPSVVSRR